VPHTITIQNDGPEIAHTDYWTSEYAMRGAVFLSINAGCFRLLVPDVLVPAIVEWRAARLVIVSRGPWPERHRGDALEILFEDDTASPYAVHIGTEQADRLPIPADRDRPGQPPRWRFAAWTSGGKAVELPCRFRAVKRIPWMRAW
jgi:hypothetical protein